MAQSQAEEPDVDLAYYLDVVMRRRWVIASVAGVVFVVAAFVTIWTRPVYQASTLIEIEKEKGGGAAAPVASQLEVNDEDYYQTQYKLLQSLSLTQQVYDSLNLKDTRDFREPHGLEKLEKAISISPVLRSRLVYVQTESHDPLLAAKISNTISQDFVSQNLSNQLFISKEVLQALQVDRTTPDAREMYDALPAVVNNPLIQTLKAEYAKLDAQAAEMSQQFTPKYPAMIALRSNMQALKAQIDEETGKIVSSMKTELSGQLKGNNVRIIDAARVPDKPVRPRFVLWLMLGLAGGVGLGLGAGFLIEVVDQSVRTQEDVENRLKLPFLGLIPLTATNEGAPFEPLFAKELSLSSEAIRNIRTMVDFAEAPQNDKAIIVASTVQSEGKTHVASNLAVAFAQLGEEVLLIDGDLRRPSVHKNFRLPSEHGLCDFLAHGKDIGYAESVLQEGVLPNLKVLVCGPRPPNPSELLNTPKLGALVAWARTQFQRVIVDCTPLFPINDTILWARHIKSAVFVVRYGQTRVPLIGKATAKLHASGSKILGVAVNAARPGGLTYSPYGYYYQEYYRHYAQKPELTSSS